MTKWLLRVSLGVIVGGAILGAIAYFGVIWALEARIEGTYFDSNGVQIHYTDEGDSSGEPVILVHGFAVNADLNWRHPGILDRLTGAGYRVIALDNRGHGLSGKPLDADAYGEEMPRDVIRLMDHLEIARAHVIGYSMGAYITLKLVDIAPERLLSAAPCGAGWAEMDGEARALIDRMATALESGDGFAPLLEAIASTDEAPSATAMQAVDFSLQRINDMAALAHVVRGFADFVVARESLQQNRVPMLSVVGSADPLRRDIDRMVGVAANHNAVYVEGGDHITTMERPELVDALLAFLAVNSNAQPDRQAAA